MLRRNWLVVAVLVMALVLVLAMTGCSKHKKNVDTSGLNTTPTDTTMKGDDTGRPKPEGVKPADFDENVKTIYFDFDKSNVRADQKAALEHNAEYLTKNHPELKLRIEGNCDERGTSEYNFALGERRAKSVIEFLVSRGVAAERLAPVSNGEEKPAAAGHDEAAWKQNRRAEFIVTQ
jgi:peptidoglycan-associated lipoprotein